MEIYFADACGDTYRDSNKPRSAELHDDDVKVNIKKEEKQALMTCFSCCTPAGARTLDTLIKSQVLYQLSYGCEKEKFESDFVHPQGLEPWTP